MAVITINGITYTGNNLVVNNGKVVMDGKNLTPDGKTITIAIEGNVDRIEVDSCEKIYINGDVGQLDTTSGDIVCNEILGNVSTTSGNVKCEGNCGGSVNTVSGNVKVNQVMGSVKTMSGDIKKNIKNPPEPPADRIIRTEPTKYLK